MEIKKELIIAASPSIIWDVLTKPQYIEKWLGVKAESDWEVSLNQIKRISESIKKE